MPRTANPVITGSIPVAVSMTDELHRWADEPLLRPGRKVGRTLYRMTGGANRDLDELVGLVDDARLARIIVVAVNQHILWNRRQEREAP